MVRVEFGHLGLVFDFIFAGLQWPLDGLIRSTYWAHNGNDIGLNILVYIQVVLYGSLRTAFCLPSHSILHLITFRLARE